MTAMHNRTRRNKGRARAKRPRRTAAHIEVGAAIVRRRGRILLCKRRADAMLGGLWEFPGGKRRRGESIRQCIRRELMEECGLPVQVGEHLIDVTHTYPRLRVTLRCYHCLAGPGRVRLLGCDDARWVRPEDIRRFPLPAADVRILEALDALSSTPKFRASGQRRGGGRAANQCRDREGAAKSRVLAHSTAPLRSRLG